MRNEIRQACWVLIFSGAALWANTLWSGTSVLGSAGLVAPLAADLKPARATAMGSAFVAIADDSSALFSNPAGLGLLKIGQASVNHNSWLVDTFGEDLELSMPWSGLGGLAVSGAYMNLGSFENRDSGGTLLGNVTANSMDLQAGWGREWLPGFYAGLSAQGLQQNLADSSQSAVGESLGLLWQATSGLRLGAAWRNNLGTQMSGYPLASGVQAGASYAIKQASSNSLLLALDASVETSGVDRIQIGAEDKILSVLAIRAGYQKNLTDSQLSGLTGWTTGLGLASGQFSVDYAFIPFGELGNSQQVSLSYNFSAVTEKSASQTETSRAPVAGKAQTQETAAVQAAEIK